jgi:hypothetical protein
MMPPGPADPRSWWDEGSWSVEPRETALARAPEFGRRFFSAVFARYPAAGLDAVFLRWAMQPDEVYAVFAANTSGVGVQIDPDLEYVIVWNEQERAEFGDWDGEQVTPAVEFFGELWERSG